jgi:hypothetical protein
MFVSHENAYDFCLDTANPTELEDHFELSEVTMYQQGGSHDIKKFLEDRSLFIARFGF